MRPVFAGLLLLTAITTGPAGASATPSASCLQAASVAEANWHLPQGLLAAIGRVETGRPTVGSRHVEPWPWSANAAGTGYVMSSRDEAVAVVGFLRQHGIASIDIGCFQINLQHHPNAFATLAEGFDPARNADYAARFLQALYGRSGDWNAAIAAYHSAEPSRGVPYRWSVLRAWQPQSPVATTVGTMDGADPHVIRLSAAVQNMTVYTPRTLPDNLRSALGLRSADEK
jgi:hypothetical protein